MNKKNPIKYFYFILFTFFAASSLGQNITYKIKGYTPSDHNTIKSLFKTNDSTNLNTKNLSYFEERLNYEGYFNFDLNEKSLNDSITNIEIKLNGVVKIIKIPSSVIPEEILVLNNLAHSNKQKDYLFIDIKQFKNFINELNNYYSSRGFPFNYIELKPKLVKKDTLISSLEIKTNSPRKIDNVIVQGYKSFPKNFIKNYLKISKSKPVNLVALKKIDTLLSELDFVSIRSASRLLFTETKSELYLKLKKQNVNEFDGFIGFTNKEKKIKLSGNLKIQLKNNFNYGESISIRYINDESDQETFETNISAPFIFSLPMQLNYNLNYFRKDSTFNSTYQFLKLDYIINNQLMSGIEYDFRKSNTLTKTINQEDYESKFVGVSIKNQKLHRRKRGNDWNYLINSKIKFGKRTAENYDSKQLIFEASILKNFFLNDKNHIQARFKINHLKSNNYLENELLRTGGVNSIRGFEENSILTNSFLLVNLEYIYGLNDELSVYPLFDLMHTANKIQRTTENLYAFGLGLKIKKNNYNLDLNYTLGGVSNNKNENLKGKISIILKTGI